MTLPRVLAIAGSDSGGGAGIQADIRTVMALGGYAATAITAVTAQNTLGVARVAAIAPAMVVAQIDAVLDDIGADAIKIGMIGSAATADAVADRLERLGGAIRVVFDPVMVATSGAVLADPATVAAFERLMRLAAVVTPNLPELAALTGRDMGDDAAVIAAGLELADRCGSAVLVKGGHGKGPTLTDRLFDGGRMRLELTSERIVTRHTHGTGCTLSSAIATLLASGRELDDAVRRAGDYVRSAIRAAPGFGSGTGPLGHRVSR